MRYTVVLEQEADGGYVAVVPALPGCVSQGDNRAEALTNIRDGQVPTTINSALCGAIAMDQISSRSSGPSTRVQESAPS